MYRRLATTIALILSSAVFLSVTACSSGPEEEEDERDRIIGAPPEQEDDPLFEHAMPAEAVPAGPSGTIGASDQPEDTASTPENEPEEPVSEPPPEVQDSREACFSCVRICPLGEDGSTRCTDRADDLICGWGASASDREQARQMAEAQCEESLDMARHMPNYAGIEGQCPAATCQ